MPLSRRTLLAGAAASVPALAGLRPSLAVAAPDRMAWWREARFGMFLHWGLYALLAGTWKDDERWAEWIRHNAKIPLDDYDRLRERWTTGGFDPDAWAALARRAGMRYVVLTTKHHDGFCLWPSAVTDFDVTATPSGRDVCAELATAFRRRGIRIGWYHSIMDWHHPDYLPRRDWEATSRPAADARFERYVAYLHAQVDELLTHYGEIDVLWFDGQWESTWTHERAKALDARIRARQPRIVVNDRINGTGTPEGARLGDFGTPENEVPATGLPGRDWEACMTMNRNWGFKAQDHDWKSPRRLAELLVETASKGGNLLLNVGPEGDGRFPAESVWRLEVLGEWMRTHGRLIYGSGASRFADVSRFRSTSHPRRLHLFVTDWRPGTALPLPGLATRPVRADLHGQGRPVRLPIAAAPEGFVVALPADEPRGLLPTITLHFDRDPVVR